MQACFLRISAPVLWPLWSPPPPPGSVAPIVHMSGTALLAARDLNEGHPTPSTLIHPRANSVTLPEGFIFYFFIIVTPRSYDDPNVHDHTPNPHTHVVRGKFHVFPGPSEIQLLGKFMVS